VFPRPGRSRSYVSITTGMPSRHSGSAATSPGGAGEKAGKRGLSAEASSRSRSSSSYGLPNRGNDLLGPAGQRERGRSIRRSAIDETGRAMIQHGAGELVDPLLDGT
jgi:hypothetical protein